MSIKLFLILRWFYIVCLRDVTGLRPRSNFSLHTVSGYATSGSWYLDSEKMPLNGSLGAKYRLFNPQPTYLLWMGWLLHTHRRLASYQANLHIVVPTDLRASEGTNTSFSPPTFLWPLCVTEIKWVRSLNRTHLKTNFYFNVGLGPNLWRHLDW